jgi:hypothetical protein
MPAIHFDAVLVHHETGMGEDTTVDGWWQNADPSVGLMHGYLEDFTITTSDDRELDVNEYGGEDHLQQLADEYRREQI